MRVAIHNFFKTMADDAGMTKRSLTLLLAAVAAVAVVTVLLVSSLGGSSDAATHRMPDGSMMNGKQMQHTMSDGSHMPGMDMSK